MTWRRWRGWSMRSGPKDVDVAFSLDAPPTGDIRSALLAAEFTEVLSGDHRPDCAGGGRPHSGAGQPGVRPAAHEGLTDAQHGHAPALLASWLGVVQAVPAALVGDGTARTFGVASILGTLTVLVYRLGVWRQEMENTKHNVGAEVKAHRDESAANFARIERLLEGISKRMSRLAEGRECGRAGMAVS
jgi:hypothetical protein